MVTRYFTPAAAVGSFLLLSDGPLLSDVLRTCPPVGGRLAGLRAAEAVNTATCGQTHGRPSAGRRHWSAGDGRWCVCVQGLATAIQEGTGESQPAQPRCCRVSDFSHSPPSPRRRTGVTLHLSLSPSQPGHPPVLWPGSPSSSPPRLLPAALGPTPPPWGLTADHFPASSVSRRPASTC